MFAGEPIFAGNPSVSKVAHFRQTVQSKYSIGLQKDSELKGLFDHEIKKMSQTGVLRRIWESWDLIFQNEKSQSDAESVPLEFTNVFIPFLFCALGIIMAITVILMERLIKLLIPEKVKLGREEEDNNGIYPYSNAQYFKGYKQ